MKANITSKILVLFLIIVFVISFNINFVNAATKETTPEAAGFSQTGSGADPGYTGDIGVNVPLLTVPGRNGFDLPVSLSYSSGIRVDDEASWVGLGWNLGVGAITRAVVNFPDDSQNGLFGPNNPSKDRNDQDLYSMSFPGGGGRFFYGCTKFDVDGNPICSNPNDYAWLTRSWGPTKIEPIAPSGLGNGIESWKVTTPDGTVYIFGKKVVSRTKSTKSKWISLDLSNGNVDQATNDNINTDKDSEYGVAWYLTEIRSNDYVDNGNGALDNSDKGSWVKISYVDKPCQDDGDNGLCNYMDPKVKGDMLTSSWELTGDYAWTRGYTFTGWNLAFTKIYYNLQQRDIRKQRTYIQSIETPIARADFTLANIRHDDLEFGDNNIANPATAPPALENITLYNTLNGNMRVNKIKLNYFDPNNINDKPYVLAKRSEGDLNYGKLTLKNITAYGEDDSISLPVTKFDYGSNPDYNRMAFDWWGYYNGATNNNGYNFKFSSPNPWPHFVTGDDNHEANDQSKAWSLTKITYPTGGSISYDYESDQYKYYVDKVNNAASGQVQVYNVITAANGNLCTSRTQLTNPVPGGGVRLKSKTIGDGVNTPYTFTYGYGDGVASEYLNFLRSFLVSWDELGPYGDVYVGYRSVTVNTPINLDPSDPNYNKPSYGYSKTDYYSNYDYPNGLSTNAAPDKCWDNRFLTNNEFKRGIPKVSASYDTNGKMIQQQTTTYNLDNPVIKGSFTDPSPTGCDLVNGDKNCGYIINSEWITATQSESILDNVKTKVTYDRYNNINGQLEKSTEENSDGDSNTRTKRSTEVMFAIDPAVPTCNGAESGCLPLNVKTAINDKNMISLPFSQKVINTRTNEVWGYSDGKFDVKDINENPKRIYPTESRVWFDANNPPNHQIDSADRYIITTTPINAYDDYGQAYGSIDAKGNVNSDGYTVSLYYGDNDNPCGNGNGFKHAYLTCVKNALGQKVETSYNTDGTVWWIQDPNLVSTYYYYDVLNRLTRIDQSNPGTGWTVPTVFYSYQYADQLCGGISETCTNRVKTSTLVNFGADGLVNYDANGNYLVGDDQHFVAAEFWDGLGRTHQYDLMLEPGTKHIRSYTKFNEIGAKLYESKPYLEEANLVAAQGQLGSLQITGRAVTNTADNNQFGIQKTSKPIGTIATKKVDKKTSLSLNDVNPLIELTSTGEVSPLNYFIPLEQSAAAQAALKSEYIYLNEPLVRIKEVKPISTETNKVSTTYSSANEAIDGVSYNGFDTYNGLFVNEVTDENGKMAKSYTDLFGNVVKTISAVGTSEEAITITKYDILNRPTQIKNAINQLTPNTYDSLGRVLTTTNPDFGNIIYTYDDNGNIVTKTHSGITVTYYYDKLNRVTKVEYTGSNNDRDANGIKNQSRNTEYFYDQIGHPGYTLNTIGRLSWKIDDAGTSTYFYDERGRLKKEKTYFRDQGDVPIFEITNWKTTEYTYDNANNIKTLKDPQSTTTNYIYDTLNRVEKVQKKVLGEAAFSDVASYTYNDEQTVKDVTFGNNVITKYDYTTRDWLTSIKTTKADGTELFKRAYKFDKAGNIENYYKDYIPATQSYAIKLATFTYDNQYRLMTAISDDRTFYVNDITYDYDKIGNRKSELYGVKNEYSYKPSTGGNFGDNRLLNDGVNTYNYDSRGNLIYKEAGNMLKNPGFSIDTGQNYFNYVNTAGSSVFNDDNIANNQIPDGWQVAGDVKRELIIGADGGISKKGPSLKLIATGDVDGPGTVRARISQDIPVEPGKTYLVEGLIKNEGLTGFAKGAIITHCVDINHNPALTSQACGLKIDPVNDPNDPYYNNPNYLVSLSDSKTTAKRISFYVTADKNTYPYLGVYCYLFADGNNAGDGSVSCNNFVVKEVDSVTKSTATSYLWDSDNKLMGLCAGRHCTAQNMIAEYYYDDSGMRAIKKDIRNNKITRYVYSGSNVIYEETANINPV